MLGHPAFYAESFNVWMDVCIDYSHQTVVYTSVMPQTLEIKKVVTKVKLIEKKTDAAYWRTQSYSARLTALEEIQQEYHRWRYGGEQRMQKVVTIIKLQPHSTRTP